ncbi:alanine racemase [Clostridia bacterium]|nr:alanine racemase [Clostridia bacterium]
MPTMTIDLVALRDNARAVKQLLNGARLCAMVKADAYGHGICETAAALRDTADCFGVAVADEAFLLQDKSAAAGKGAGKDILIVGPVEEYAAREAVRRDLNLTLANRENLDILISAARAAGKRARVHIKVDTGMHRLGIGNIGEFQTVLRRAASSEYIRLEGVFTHYATSDTGGDYAEYQYGEFRRFLGIAREALGERAYGRLVKHGACSGAILRDVRYHMDMARAGLVLYGCFPSPDLAGKIHIRPAMRVTAGVAQLKRCAAGDKVGYGNAYACPRDCLLAAARIGYGDGYKRAFSGNGFAVVRGARCPIVGKVCMDLTMIDVTNVTNMGYNDPVTFLGDGVTADELAARCGTIGYEILTAWHGTRVKREYI